MGDVRRVSFQDCPGSYVAQDRPYLFTFPRCVSVLMCWVMTFDKAGDVQSDWGSRLRQFDRSASSVSATRRYASDVTDPSQRARRFTREYYAPEFGERNQHSWVSRNVFDESRRRHRALDPVSWSLMNSASNADVPSSSSSSVWESSSYMSDLPRRRRRQLRVASPSSWTGTDSTRDDSPPPSWQTNSIHGSSSLQTLTNSLHGGDTASLSLPSFSRRRFPPESIQPGVSRAPLAGPPTLSETSSLADVHLWSTSRRERDGTSFTPYVEDIENDLEDVTSTGAEAGSTASIGGDTESIDADAEVRSVDFELGSVGAEVLVSGSGGSGAEIGVVDPLSTRSHYDGLDYGPSAGDTNLRGGTSRNAERLAEHVDRDRVSSRRWRWFHRTDLPDRTVHQSSLSSAAASNGSSSIMDWVDLELTRSFPPQHSTPQRREIPDFAADWFSRDHATSAASDFPRLREYASLQRARRGRPPYSGSGASSTSASHHPHECLPNCEICNGGPGRLMQPLNHYLSELAGDQDSSDSAVRGRPFTTSYETLAPAASAAEDDDPIVESLAALQQEIETTRGSVPTWRESSASSVDPGRFPAMAEFERRVRRLDERVTQMQRRLLLQADREPRPPSLSYRLRERHDMLRSQLDTLRSQYGTYSSSDVLESRRNYHDGLLPSASASITGYGSTGAEAVNELINLGR